jgi:hypothetical protein
MALTPPKPKPSSFLPFLKAVQSGDIIKFTFSNISWAVDAFLEIKKSAPESNAASRYSGES